jgi:hypothetical protein
VSGSWTGFPGDTLGMDVSVRVRKIDPREERSGLLRIGALSEPRSSAA